MEQKPVSRAEFVALESLVIAIAQAMADSSIASRQSLERLAHQMAELPIPIAHPIAEVGDHLAGEYQEAWARLMQRVLKPIPQ